MSDCSVSELKERLAKGEKPNLLDVREVMEHQEFNIGGKLIPLGLIPVKMDELASWKDQEIIVYCRSGNRSSMAVRLLQQAGFSGARNLTGGMLAWR